MTISDFLSLVLTFLLGAVLTAIVLWIVPDWHTYSDGSKHRSWIGRLWWKNPGDSEWTRVR